MATAPASRASTRRSSIYMGRPDRSSLEQRRGVVDLDHPGFTRSLGLTATLPFVQFRIDQRGAATESEVCRYPRWNSARPCKGRDACPDLDRAGSTPFPLLR